MDNTITGIEDLYLDVLDANSIDATTIVLNGSDLQTTLTNLQTQINTSGAGGYFILTAEFNGSWVQGGYFSYGSGIGGNLPVMLPNCTLIGYIITSSTAVTATTNIQITKNGSQQALMTIANGGTQTINTTLSINFALGDYVRVRFPNTAGQGAGGGTYRSTLIFQTAAVNGTNGTNGTNGLDGQNVSFNAPTIATITPATAASINDIITTASGTQTHALTFNIPRGKNSNFQVGTISSTGLNPPSLSISGATDANGDNLYTMNFGLQRGEKGDKGDKGDKGNDGDQAESTIVAIGAAAAAATSAAAAAAAAGAAAASAATAATAGASAGAQAGSSAAEAVLSSLDTRVTILEGEMDIQQTKTQYISQSVTETTIGGGRTICNSTYGFLSNTIEADSLSVSTTINTNDLNVTGESYFANDILIGDTKKLLTNQIVQRQYPANGDILIDATNLNIGSSFNDSINLQGDNINIITNTAGGIITFENALANTDVNVVIQGIASISEDLTAGTNGELNTHNLYGTTLIQKLDSIANIDLDIGTDTNILNIGGNGNTTNININSTNVYSTNTIFDVEATNITLSSDLDISEITIGSILDLDTSVTINTRDINIGTNGIGMTTPTLNIGTYNRTLTEIRGETIEILASETTSINGSSNLVLDATTIDIGNSSGDVNIQGSTIDIGTTGVLNTINIGNNYSSVNINTIDTQYITIENFVNQLGF